MTNLRLTRNDFKQLTDIRLKEAKLLLDNAFYDGAYYLCGYAVECGLKACIAKQTRKYDFPDKNLVDRSYCHDVEKLLGLAELTHPAKDERAKNNDLQANWNIVIKWNEEGRYSTHDEVEAKLLYSAIADKQNGVLKWIKKYW